jgi:hypothetical protein
MNEDMILPDDFEMPTEAETVEDTTPTEETEVEAPETTGRRAGSARNWHS